MIEQPAHSPIGASSCERWWNCPGSVKLMEGLPSQPGTIYSATGTIAHGLGERVLLNKFDPSDEIGISYVEDGFEVEVTEEMVEAVQVYIDTITDYVDAYGLDWATDVKVEVKFGLTHIDPQAFGTCDASISILGKRLIVVDYKHGRGYAVEVENNYQLQYYALGAYYALPEEQRRGISIIEMVIVQPRASHIDGPVRRHVYSVDDLLRFERDLKLAVARIRRNDSELQSGSWCKFCGAKAVCPSIRKNLEETTGVPGFVDADVSPVLLPAPGTLDPQRIARLIANAEILQSWIKSVFALGTAVADNGTTLPGYKLVTKYGRRRWKSEQDVEDAFALDFGEKIYNKKVKSPAQMEKLLGTKRKDELESYYEIPVTGKTLVHEGDAREGISTGAGSVFEEYTG